jgi:hypothetical protein
VDGAAADHHEAEAKPVGGADRGGKARIVGLGAVRDFPSTRQFPVKANP